MDTIHFIGFLLRIIRILLHLKFPSNSQDLVHLKQLFCKTTPRKQSEKSPFSRNLVWSERKRQGQGGVMWTEYHKRSDSNHIGWIDLIQSDKTHCAKLGLMRVQESYIDTFTDEVAAPGLFGGFSFHSLKKLKVGGFMIPL